MLPAIDMGLLGYLLRRLALPRREPRLVRRVEMQCPHDGRPAQVDLLLGPTGRPSMVLRCDRRCEAPPECDQLCRSRAEALTNEPVALLMLPPGDAPPEELD
jgi:hypothetical protein